MGVEGLGVLGEVEGGDGAEGLEAGEEGEEEGDEGVARGAGGDLDGGAAAGAPGEAGGGERLRIACRLWRHLRHCGLRIERRKVRGAD